MLFQSECGPTERAFEGVLSASDGGVVNNWADGGALGEVDRWAFSMFTKCLKLFT